jgi:hypothetical protein
MQATLSRTSLSDQEREAIVAFDCAGNPLPVSYFKTPHLNGFKYQPLDEVEFNYTVVGEQKRGRESLSRSGRC